jgi:hypothetical protein
MDVSVKLEILSSPQALKTKPRGKEIPFFGPGSIV